MTQLNDDQMTSCYSELITFCPKIVGCGSDGAIDFFASSNPTQAEKDGAIAIMNKYITSPQVAFVRIDPNH